MKQSVMYLSCFDLTTNTKLLYVLMSPSPYMWIFFKWTCMLKILDQSKYGRIFIHKNNFANIFYNCIIHLKC